MKRRAFLLTLLATGARLPAVFVVHPYDTQAARRLGIDPSTLWRKLKQEGE
jgi:hypothetical protein